jgi:hypothetical protein
MIMDAITRLARVVSLLAIAMIGRVVSSAGGVTNVNSLNEAASVSLTELNASWTREMAMASTPSGFSAPLHAAIMSERVLELSSINMKQLNSG